jgi:hypothetical protein
MFLKTFIDNNEQSEGELLLSTLVQEHEANMPDDHSVMKSELQHMQHALSHFRSLHPEEFTSDEYQRQKLKNILSYEPEQNTD